MALKLAVMLSRHEPTAAMTADLKRRGYRLEVVNPANRLLSAEDAIMLACNRNKGIVPELFVIHKLPLTMLEHLLRRLRATSAVIQPVMDYRCEPPRWCGQWQRVTAVYVKREEWVGG